MILRSEVIDGVLCFFPSWDMIVFPVSVAGFVILFLFRFDCAESCLYTYPCCWSICWLDCPKVGFGGMGWYSVGMGCDINDGYWHD